MTTVQQMQQQLINQISAINDEDILRMIEAEISMSLQSQADLSQLLTESELKELTSLANEPIDKNTISLSEFNTIMEQWHMK